MFFFSVTLQDNLCTGRKSFCEKCRGLFSHPSFDPSKISGKSENPSNFRDYFSSQFSLEKPAVMKFAFGGLKSSELHHLAETRCHHLQEYFLCARGFQNIPDSPKENSKNTLSALIQCTLFEPILHRNLENSLLGEPEVEKQLTFY